eukprot:CAMPEP_0197194802 /NCGR_PEP_ID=MMETSP1423-20130617/29888_1 /TAXON_ID=476441 /ORGANISM="Pseudo-nitzschia heimii, Strain UNC1101" /LENGTH=182 /DNA_ID=CAMNT_0042648285 /DNA_START=93 /DNA_END=642 /DNA_ORIENTATION=-
MKYSRGLLIVFLVLIAAVDAQSGGPTQEEKNDKDDKDDEVNPNDQLDSIPSDFEDIDLSDDALDFNSTEPSESPSAMRINSESSSPSMLPSSSPSRGESPQLPTTPFGECAGKPCDKDDALHAVVGRAWNVGNEVLASTSVRKYREQKELDCLQPPESAERQEEIEEEEMSIESGDSGIHVP